MREMVRVSKALADETRIRMLKLLLERDICLCEMKEVFDKSQSQISRDLRTLRDAGFLRRWNEGKCVVYVADWATRNSHCRALLDVIAGSFEDEEVVAEDRKRLGQAIAKQVREKTR